MKQFNIEKVYDAYFLLNKLQRKKVLNQLNESGMHLKAIKIYTYPEAPGCKHLFFYFENSNKAVPYYLLEASQLLLVQETILNI